MPQKNLQGKLAAVKNWIPAAKTFNVYQDAGFMPRLPNRPEMVVEPVFSERELMLFQMRVESDERIAKVLRAAILKNDFPEQVLPEFDEEIEQQIKTVIRSYFNKSQKYVEVSKLALTGDLYQKPAKDAEKEM